MSRCIPASAGCAPRYNPAWMFEAVQVFRKSPAGGAPMPSPFPGMNPYIERASVWHDFHESFMPLAREILSAQLLPRYFVRIDEHMYIHERSAEERRFVGRGDLLVTRLAPPGTASTTASSV